jgi:hypothetical protein
MNATAVRLSRLSPRSAPSASEMVDELRAAIQQGEHLGLYDKLAVCHNTLHCLWAGQHPSGMLLHENAKPWRGAIDSRVRESKKVVQDTVRLMMRAVRSGSVSIGPEGLGDEEQAQTWDSVLRYYRQRAKRQINDSLKLFFTSVVEFGYGIMHVDWRDRQQLLPHKIDTETIRARLYAINQAQLVAELPPEAEGVLPPEMDAELAAQVAVMTEEMLMLGEESPALMELLQSMDPKMPTTEARLAAKALRKTGSSTYYAPRSKGGHPQLRALIPGVNCLHGMDLTSEVKTWIALPERLSEAELRERAALNGWTVKLDDLLEHPNKGMAELEGLEGRVTQPDWLLNGVGVGLKLDKNENIPWFEVVTLYRVAVNEAGIPAVYESEIFPALPDLLLSHECLPLVRDDGAPAMPFVVMNREPVLLSVQSAGVPEEMLTDQLAMKKIWDGSIAAAELAAFPPAVRTAQDKDPVMPGATITLDPRQTGTRGAQSRFLDVPGVNMGAMRAIELLRQEVNERYHRGQVDPDLRAAYEEDLGNEAVLAFTEVIRLLWANIQAYVSDLTATRIAGRQVMLDVTEEDLMGAADIHIDFSPVSLNQARAKEKNEFVKTLLQYGSPRVDVDAAVEDVARTWDVNLAERIIIPAETGTGQATANEQQAIAEMQSGQQVTGRLNAPQARLSAYQQWLANPEAVDMLAYRPPFLELVINRVKALEMQHEQHTTNVQIGQTGQKPPSWEQQEKLSERILMMVQQRQQELQQSIQQPAA